MKTKFKRILSAMLVLIMVFSMVPVSALAADNGSFQTAAIFFSDVHGNATAMTPVLDTIRGSGVSYETVGLVGDAFSPTTTGNLTSVIQNSLNQNVSVFYAWGHQDSGSSISPNSGLLYRGDHYYIYHISDADMRANAGATNDGTAAAISAFNANVASMDKDKVLFIMSHIPLHVGTGDNNQALQWYLAVEEAANMMDVVFFWGHNHDNETFMDTDAYFVASNGSESISIPNGGTRIPSFTYMNAGYIDGNHAGRLGVATTVKIYENALVFQDYNANGEYSGAYAHNVTVTREFAAKPPHEHNYQSEVIAVPTCAADGSTKYTCSCGDSYTETIPAKGHNYVESRCIDPTCYDTGSITYTCTICNDSYTDELPAFGHWYETITTNATCTQNGSVVTVCSDCGELESEPVVIPATGHNYVKTVTDATCTKDGSIIIRCANCGELESEPAVIPATGHDYSTSGVAPSCTRYGYTKYTCKTCKHYYYDDEVTPTGHKYTTVVTAPSCTNEGFATSTCENCGISIVTDNFAALGHSYTGKESADKTAIVYTCENCQHSYSEEIISGYSYKKVTKFTTDDTFVITLYANKKYYALSHEGNQLSVVPVTVSNNEITSKISENMLWSHNNKRLYYKDSDLVYYLTTVSTSLFGTPNLSIGTSGPATVSFSSSKLKVGSNYLRFANNMISLDRNATTTYLFMQTD